MDLNIVFPNEESIVYSVGVIKYLNDNRLEEEVNTMTKTLYDPEVEKMGIEKGIQQGMIEKEMEIAKNLLDILDDETIAIKTGLDIETVKKLRLENMN